MAAKNKAAKAGAAVAAARTNPYIVRMLEDDELRNNLMAAYESARGAYTKLADGKHPASSVFEDKKLQRDLQSAAVSLREVGLALKDAPKKTKPKKRKKRGRGVAKKLLVVGVAAGLALALSESLRKKALDALFGAEEEFEYTSPTGAPPAPEPAGTSS